MKDQVLKYYKLEKEREPELWQLIVTEAKSDNVPIYTVIFKALKTHFKRDSGIR